ncbi:hexosyltransferase [Halorubrum ezzemoulense]|uniref:Glycosyltransferase family 1 protein n=1 Tax=Halorubrum ezzemoulense TaxID=337243 RepID=A0A256K7A8_HALEZ|nr:hexosyltransferase [Halorubrum ezzemoulense]QAY19733.1 glycosyltransferase family 1 protein [Halorubrum ezzemoulense]TKX63180.1 glycosyltransferase family 1 protein [Halorubrum sp. GN12_10-3_MGM]
MEIGYFCYRLSGTGPRTRAADIINAVAERSPHDVTVLTNEPEKIRGPAEVHTVSIGDPADLLWTAKQAFSDADVVHVPINTYQVLFVRLVYHGPLIGGVGPGLQSSVFHRAFGRLLAIDTKMKVHEGDKRWDVFGYDTEICTATIDRDLFYPYEADRCRQLRVDRGIDTDQLVILYVGKLTEEQGAGIVDEMALQTAGDDSIRYIVVGDGPLSDRFKGRQNISFEGFVDNKTTPEYYNLADVTVAPRCDDNTSNVGLESIACGTPMVTTAGGDIVDLFQDRGTYVWADERTAASVLVAVQELCSDKEDYEAQVQRGFDTLAEMELTLESALQTHLRVYGEAAETY